MKPAQPSRYDRFGLAVLKKVLFYGTLFVSVALAALLFQLEAKYKIRAAGVAAVIVIVCGLVVAFLTVPQVISLMREDKSLLLSDAVVETFYSYLMMASFLPVVGPLFSRALAKKKSSFTQDVE